ncbi:uncharacterized protein LOC127573714 isoform X2 [Pristis pectinata]|uniref:uncharacterized protein LOC127573714 isoform X2 n=1 Tax=Pristis pectinata TaxID=685728 RepID=UPI00223D25E7|nr:uncharacterized protein LOC127573714 isoform X2 [Pristis pectinata]
MSSPRAAPPQSSPLLGGDTGLMERPGSEGVNPTVQVTQRPGSEGVNPTIQVTQRPGSEDVNPTIRVAQRPGSEGVNPTVQVTPRPGSEGVNPTVQVTPQPRSEGVNPTVQITPRPESEGTSHCTVFTYFKGDINSVVDEHFSRALRCAEARPRRKPEDMERAGEKLPSMPWLQPPIWPHPYLGAPLPPAGRTSEGGPMTTAQYQPDNCPNLRAAAADPWLLPSSRAQGVGSLLYQPPLLQLHQMLPAVDSERQYSALREPVPGHRAAPGTHLPRHKTVVPSPWTGIAPGLPEAMNPEVGQGSENWRNEGSSIR